MGILKRKEIEKADTPASERFKARIHSELLAALEEELSLHGVQEVFCALETSLLLAEGADESFVLSDGLSRESISRVSSAAKRIYS